MVARIFQPTKSAMQSGEANRKLWILEFEPEKQKKSNTFMGWSCSGDMRSQVKLKFRNKEEAIRFAERNGILYGLHEPKIRQQQPKSYADNFRFTKVN